MAWSQSKREKQKGNQENKQSLKMAEKYGHWGGYNLQGFNLRT